MKQTTKAKASIDFFKTSILCRGIWKVNTMQPVIQAMNRIPLIQSEVIIIDCSGIQGMDTAGAWFLWSLVQHISQKAKVNIVGLTKNRQLLFQSIQDIPHEQFPRKPSHHTILYQMGEESIAKINHLHGFVKFLGQFTTTSLNILKNPANLAYKHVLMIIDETGVRAMPIVALLTFLIGVVLAYQMGLQLQMYGANVYIVTLSGMAILREFSPLITAIIVAGRTSSAFAALIGMMKVNQEIDALNTMGVSAIERLVVPRVLGLLIALPLLSFWADVFGILGSMMMAKSMLDIGYYDFITRLRDTIELQTYVIGLIKAPVFALIVAFVGCFQGFQVTGDADSVGRQTTKAVVQAIFLIIIADAIFSVMFSWQGI